MSGKKFYSLIIKDDFAFLAELRRKLPIGGSGSAITVDTVVTDGSPNPVSGNAVYDAIAAATSTGLSTLNTLTDTAQTFAFDATGTTPGVTSAAGVHTFHFPLAATGVGSGTISNGNQTIDGIKTFSNGIVVTTSSTNFYPTGATGSLAATSANYLFASATGVNMRTGFNNGSANTVMTAAYNYAGSIILGGTATEGTSGTHNIVTALAIRPVALTNGTATTTNAATVYIEGPTTGTATPTNTYALWVDSGNVQFDGNLTVNGTINGLTLDSTALSAAGKLIESQGGTFLGETINVPLLLAGAATTLNDASIKYQSLYCHKSGTATGIAIRISTQGSFVADNFNGVALFTQSAGTLTQVAISANDGNIWQQVPGVYGIPFTTPYAVTAGTVYWVAFLYNSSSQTTAPVVRGVNLVDNIGGTYLGSVKFGGGTNTVTAMPSSVTVASMTAGTTSVWASLY